MFRLTAIYLRRLPLPAIMRTWYAYVQHESDLLITSLLFRKIFPATTNKTTVAESYNVMQECWKRLREARVRRAIHNLSPSPSPTSPQ